MYAVTRGDAEPSIGGLSGVAGVPLHAVDAYGLVAVVSAVDPAAFGEDALRRNLGDLDWVASTATIHDSVVRAVARHAPTIPLRLGTVCAGNDQVRALLQRHREEFDTGLEVVTDRTEWGVKAYVDSPAPHSPGDTADSPSPTPESGTAYLHRRRAQLSERERAGQAAVQQSEAAHAALAAIATAVRAYPVRDRASVHGGREILNAAYLVDDSRSEEFRQTVADQDLACNAIRLELTGPWPPYSFATSYGATSA